MAEKEPKLFALLTIKWFQFYDIFVFIDG